MNMLSASENTMSSANSISSAASPPETSKLVNDYVQKAYRLREPVSVTPIRNEAYQYGNFWQICLIAAIYKPHQ